MAAVDATSSAGSSAVATLGPGSALWPRLTGGHHAEFPSVSARVDPLMVEGPAIRVRGLRKRYGSVTAVEGVDLEIAHGEVVALLGPNGAGKTTTVEILEGYRNRDAGEVSVLGEDPQRAPLRWRYGIGIVLQEAKDAAELTVAETVRHFAGYYPRPRDPAEVIEIVGLTEKARARVRTLSGGQRRRLDVAVGIVGRPRVLFLDEPTTGFDPQARRQFWTLVRSLATDDGTTILLTTHYLEEAEALADRVAVIACGRIVAEGDPATLGGRAAAEATVTWLDGTTAQTARTADPAALVGELTTRFGGSVPGLAVRRPSLEDIYLELIGEEQP
jgi:ABC-2 type transport system ATP-binding protein